MKPSGVNPQRNGLTLVEILVLLAIFLVLLAAMLPSFATQ
jgi:type II secretory pathway pseudopilin PulG